MKGAVAPFPGRGHVPAAALPARSWEWRAARSRPPVNPTRRRPTPAPRAAAAVEPADGDQQPPAALAPPPSPQELAALAGSPAAFEAALRRLGERGSGCTEAHVVAAWAAQTRSRALRAPLQGEAPAQGLQRQRQEAVLGALAALERLTRQQLVALAPDQLGFVARCYVLAGGGSTPLLAGVQAAACQWRGEDFSAAGLAELAWALASCGQPLSPGCRQLVRSALRAGGSSSGGAEEQPAAAGEPQQPQQPQQRQRQRDWDAWFDGAPASRVVLLLWAAARLQCTPCTACFEAALSALLRGQGMSKLPTKSLVTLLWALATLRAAQQPALQPALAPVLSAATLRLAERAEAHLGPAGSWDSDAEGWPSPSLSLTSEEELSAGSGEEDDGSHVGGTMDEDEAEEAEAAVRSSSGEQAAAAAAWYAGRTAGGAGSSRQAEAEAALADLPTASLTTAVWACGQLRHSDPRMLRAAATLLHGRVHAMLPADITRLLWGVAQLGFCPSLLLGAVAARLQEPAVLPAFAPPQLAMATYAFAALDFYPGQDCVDALADAALAARARLDPRALAHVLWNMSRLGYVDEPFYAAFVPVILPGIGQYGPAELADVARVYSRAGLNPALDSTTGAAADDGAGADGADGGGAELAGEGGTLFDALAAQTVACIHGAEIQDILRIVTAFHQMGLQPEALLQAVERWANQRLRKLSPQSLSLALWSFARMGSGSPGLLETAAACAEEQLGAFTPGQLAKVAWSFAKLGWPAPRVLRHAGAQLAATTAAFTDKEASNVLWALASAGEPLLPAAELDSIAANLRPRLRAFGPQSLANIAWAYATLAHAPPPPFLRELGDAALPQLRAFEPQGLSLLVWALASLGSCHNQLFAEMVRLLLERPTLLRQFEGQHLANLLWGLCRAGFRPVEPFLLAIAKEAELRVCDLKPQELFNLAWAFTQLGHHPRRLFAGLAREVVPRAFAFTPQELSGTLWALAKAQHAAPAVSALLHAVEREVAVRGPDFEDRHLAILCWSFGQLAHVPSSEAWAPLLAQLQARVGAMSGRSLATLVAGLADMEEQRRWQQQQAQQRQQQQQEQQQQQADDGAEQLAEQSTDAARSSAAAAQPLPDAALVPQPLAEALGERAAALLSQLQAFELVQLVRGLAVLGSQAAAERFLYAPSPQADAQLAAAARSVPLPLAVGLLWAMAAWSCYPAQLLAVLRDRLRHTSPHYRLPQPALALLGQALQAMDERQRAALGLRNGMALAATAAARNVEMSGPPRALLSPSSGINSESDGEAAAEAEDEASQARRQQAQRRRHGGLAAAPTAPQPACDNNNLEPGWLESTYDDMSRAL